MYSSADAKFVAPVARTSTVEPTVMATGMYSALSVASFGSALRSARTSIGWIDWRKAAPIPSRPGGLDICLLAGRAGAARRRGFAVDAFRGAVGVRHLGSIATSRLGAVGPLGASHGLSCDLTVGRVVRIVVDT